LLDDKGKVLQIIVLLTRVTSTQNQIEIKTWQLEKVFINWTNLPRYNSQNEKFAPQPGNIYYES
jgi:hypothetical protein